MMHADRKLSIWRPFALHPFPFRNVTREYACQQSIVQMKQWRHDNEEENDMKMTASTGYLNILKVEGDITQVGHQIKCIHVMPG